MPLAMLTGRGRLDLLRAVGLEPMPERDVVLSDARNLDPREAELLAASAVTRIASIDEAIAMLPPDRPVYVHVDVDVVTAPSCRRRSTPSRAAPRPPMSRGRWRTCGTRATSSRCR